MGECLEAVCSELIARYDLKPEDGTERFDTYPMESMAADHTPPLTAEERAAADRYAGMTSLCAIDPNVETLVTQLIGRVADKWTLLVLEALAEKGTLRFSRLCEAVAGVSQKMLTQTLRAMERDGLVTRTIYPVVPPKVEYTLTPLGLTLGAAFCGVWVWASENLNRVEQARAAFDQSSSGG